MIDDAERDIASELETFARVRPGAYALARVLSLAARVEHGLVRRARLLLPDIDASAEGDLWASRLIASQTAQGIVFDPAVAAVLRQQLAADVALFEAAADLIAWEHRNAPWPVRAEELINRLTASGTVDVADRCEQILVATARQMVDTSDRVGAARWLMRTLTRLPPTISASPAARAIQVGVGAELDGQLALPNDLPPDSMENWLPWLFAGTTKRRAIRLTIGDGFLGIDASEPDASGPDTILIPDTAPLLVDLYWHDGLSPHVVRVTLDAGDQRRIAVTSQFVEVRAIDGTRGKVRVAGGPEHTRGIDFSAVRARHRPFVGREQELAEIDSLLERTRTVGIVGDPGLGKTALLCALLDRFESRGERVIEHFPDGGPEVWRDAAFIESSLRSQLLAMLPAPMSSNRALDLDELIRQVANGRPLYLLIDDADRVNGNPFDALARTRLPEACRLIYTSVQARTDPDALMRQQAVINLNDRTASTRAVCLAYFRLHRAVVGHSFASPERDRSPVAFLMYTPFDLEPAKAVELRLNQLNVRVITGSDELAAGQSWQAELLRRLEEADFFVVLASVRAAASEGFRFDLETLLQMERPIIPITDNVAGALTTPLRQLREWRFLEFLPSGDVPLLDEAIRQFRPGLGVDRRIRLLLERSGGHIDRAVAMIDWLRDLVGEPYPMERMPPTLYGAFDEAWQSVAHGDDDPGRAVLGLLAAARAPIVAGVLRAYVPDDAAADVLSRLEASNLVAVIRSFARGEEPVQRYAVSHDSVRPAVLKKFSNAEIRRFHRALADAEDDDPQYALGYRLAHLIGAADIEGAIEAASDIMFLTRICTDLGVENLEMQLTQVVAAGRPPEDTVTEPLSV